LDLLYKEGYVANTPSKELATNTFGSGGIGGGHFFTPGNELTTPGFQLTGKKKHFNGQITAIPFHPSESSFGVLMAQQTGLTPCQHGPVPVLIQPQDNERPQSGHLSELR
jgi:hypothetical protein